MYVTSVNSTSMRYSLTLLLLVAIHTLVTGTPVDSLRAEKRGEQWVVIHQVDAGETLYAIARRYKADINQVIKANDIKDNAIQVGQLLEIPVRMVSNVPKSQTSASTKATTHTVAAGETLYSLSRKYNVKVDDIIGWNNLDSESLNVGQVLKINGSSTASNTPTTSQLAKDDGLPFPRARKHHVQVGETLNAIATKRNVSEDSLRKWNKLASNNISIGQTLWYRTYLRTDAPATSREAYGKKVEEGIAMQIEDMENTDKYLALHKSLPIGTLVEIRNLMNNKKVYVRVVGQLPDTGVNQNVIVRLTSQSFKRLGILDARARVELTYYEE